MQSFETNIKRVASKCSRKITIKQSKIETTKQGKQFLYKQL